MLKNRKQSLNAQDASCLSKAMLLIAALPLHAFVILNVAQRNEESWVYYQLCSRCFVPQQDNVVYYSTAITRFCLPEKANLIHFLKFPIFPFKIFLLPEKSTTFAAASLIRPAPAEPPQGRNAARISG